MGQVFNQRGRVAPFLALFFAISALTAGPLSLVLGFASESNGESEEFARDGEVEAVEFCASARNPSGRSTVCGSARGSRRTLPRGKTVFSQRRRWIPLFSGDSLYQLHQRRLL